MQEGFWYLFAAYTVIFAVLFGYVITMFLRQRQLQREIDSLKKTLRKRDEG